MTGTGPPPFDRATFRCTRKIGREVCNFSFWFQSPGLKSGFLGRTGAEAPNPYFRPPQGVLFLFFSSWALVGASGREQIDGSRRKKWKWKGRGKTTNQEQGLVAEGKDAKLEIGKELLRNGRCFSGTALLSIACKALETPALKHGKTGAW